MSSDRLYNLSLDYFNGNGVEKDLKQSFSLNAQAAESGQHDAVLAMGWYYLNGCGISKDINMSKLWYRKSARQGNSSAMFSLGQIAYVEKDSSAVTWFQRALKAGHPRSVFWLGKLYWHGQCVDKDKKKAMQLFTEAARKKVKEAQRTLRWINKRNTQRIGRAN